MLVLKRYLNQRIRLTVTGELKIGDVVEIALVEAAPGWARIGLQADREKVQILRQELVIVQPDAA